MIGLDKKPIYINNQLTANRPEFEKLTIFYLEMEICAEHLHITHEEFRKLPKDERLKFLAYIEMKRKREEFFEEQKYKYSGGPIE